MIKSLPNDSSPGYDQITSKILKALPGNWLLALKDLFNVIVLSGSYPKQWSKSIIKPIYKSGDPNNTNNYRGISLLSCVGKLLSSILSKRLSNWAEENDVLCDEQFGFRKNRRTTDAVFILQCLIQKQTLQRSNLYSCFVDLSKAFDCVNHDLLWLRLFQLGINPVILQFLKAYYTHATACVVTQSGYTNSFAISRGVRQGCPLSPLLFSLLINSLPVRMTHTSLYRKRISCLLFADDVVLFGTSPKDLQDSLDSLVSFCDESDLSVNMAKTKIVPFGANPRFLRESWTINEHTVEGTDSD